MFYRWHWLIGIFIILVKPTWASGDEVVIEISHEVFSQDVKKNMACLIGKNADLQLDEVSALPSKAFEPLNPFAPYYSQIPIWCRLIVANRTNSAIDTALVISLPQPFFQAYYASDQSDFIPAKSLRSLDNPSIVFGLTLNPGNSTILLHFQPVSPYELLIHPSFSDLTSYRHSSTLQLISLMLSQGILWTLGLYYLMVGIALHRKSHIYYALSNTMLALLILSQAGYTNLYYIPDFGFGTYIPRLNRALFINLIVFFSLYCIHFLEVNERFPRITILIQKAGKIWLAFVFASYLFLTMKPEFGGLIFASIVTLNFTLPILSLGMYILGVGLIQRHKFSLILTSAFIPPTLIFFSLILIPHLDRSINWADGLSYISIGISLPSLILGISLANQLSSDRKRAERVRNMMIATNTVQSALLPPPALSKSQSIREPIELTTYYSAADEAGGDWFSYHFDPDNEHFLLQICDVTGHGIPAAIITGVITGAAYSCLEDFEHDRSATAETKLIHMANKINRVLIKTGARVNCFATMAFVLIDTSNGKGYLCGAGHTPMYIFGENHIRAVPSRGSILGFQEDTNFNVKAFTMKPGESLFCYTDGLLENTNRRGMPIKAKQLRNILCINSSPEDAKKRIIAKITEHWKGAPCDDDVSFVIARYNGKNKAPFDICG